MTSIFDSSEQRSIERLSPSEKYDLMIGDRDAPLTNYAWSKAQRYGNNRVPGWVGLCHGWAAAAHMWPGPKRAVTVMGYDGQTPIRLYPSDIKALITSLWAHGMPRSNFLGGRCRVSNPARDMDCRDLHGRHLHYRNVS